MYSTFFPFFTILDIRTPDSFQKCLFSRNIWHVFVRALPPPPGRSLFPPPPPRPLKIGAVETRFRRKCMTVLLALCPLVVEATDGLRDRPSDSDGARAWVWRRLEESGRGGVTEAVRVFEDAASRSSAAVAGGGGGGGGLGGSGGFGGESAPGAGAGGGEGQGKHAHDAEKDGWDRVATSADCYNFARETGIITAGELFLGSAPAGGGGGGGGNQGSGRASGKKRKASSVPSVGGGAAGGGGGDDPADDARTSPATQPRVLRSLAGVVERFGEFLEGLPFQSLVGEGENGQAGDAKVDGGRHPASSSNNR